MNNSCKSIQERLPAYSEDDLSAAEREAVDCHLGECEECRRELDLLIRAWDTLDLLGEELEPSALFRARVWERIRQEPPPTVFERFFGWLSPRFGQVGATMAAGVVVVSFMFGSQPAADPPVVATTPDQIPYDAVVLSRDPFRFRPVSREYSPIDPELSIELTMMDIGNLSDPWMHASNDVLDQSLRVRPVSW